MLTTSHSYAYHETFVRLPRVIRMLNATLSPLKDILNTEKKPGSASSKGDGFRYGNKTEGVASPGQVHISGKKKYSI